MGPSFPTGHVPGGRLLQGGLLSVPQHVRGTYAAAQRQGTRREEVAALARVHPHPRVNGLPRRPSGQGVFCGLYQHRGGKGPPGRDGGSPAEQAAEDELIREGGPAEEGAGAQLAALGESLQHGRPAAEAPAPQLFLGAGGQQSAAAQVPEGGLRTHDSVYRRPVPAQPGSRAGPCSSPHAQPPALRCRKAGGQVTREATEDERRPLTSDQERRRRAALNCGVSGSEIMIYPRLVLFCGDTSTQALLHPNKRHDQRNCDHEDVHVNTEVIVSCLRHQSRLSK